MQKSEYFAAFAAMSGLLVLSRFPAHYGAQEAARKRLQPWIGNKAVTLSNRVNVPGTTDGQYYAFAARLAERKTGVPTFVWNDPKQRTPYWSKFDSEADFHARTKPAQRLARGRARPTAYSGLVDALSLKSRNPLTTGHEIAHGENMQSVLRLRRAGAGREAQTYANTILRRLRGLPDSRLGKGMSAAGVLASMLGIPVPALKYVPAAVVHAPAVMDEALASWRGAGNAKHLGYGRLNLRQKLTGKLGIGLGLASYLAAPVAAWGSNYLAGKAVDWFNQREAARR